jgi:predicted MFS family arabinose efflux permease
MQSIQNLGLAVFSLLSGVLVENYGYYVLELFFLCLCLIGLLFAIILYFVDKLKNGKLCIAKKSKEDSIN